MQFLRGQPAERIDHILVRELEGVGNGLALEHLGGDGAGGDGAGAAEGLKLHILDPVFADLQIDLHDVAAFCVADLADTVRVFDRADIARVHEMIHDGLCIKCHCNFLLTV